MNLLVKALALVVTLSLYSFCIAKSDGESIKSFILTLDDKVEILRGEKIHAKTTLSRFYEQRNYQPVWNVSKNSVLYDRLLRAVELASEQGLDPLDYHFSGLQQAKVDGNMLIMEILATDAYLTLAAHIVGGRLQPETFEPDWTANRRERDIVKHLDTALVTGKVEESLIELEPDSAGYQLLKQSLKIYRQAKIEGGWETIPEGKALKVGESGPRVGALVRRLKATGFLDLAHSSAEIFNTELEDAVANFQRRLGLEADGVVGSVTLSELNKTPDQRIGQIKANMERWRWLPEDLGNRHIRVNIADFRLTTYEYGKIVKTHDVIVGRTYRKTPVFSDQIAYLILNPWWETPDNLARLDKLPAFRKNPDSVKKLGFEILDKQGKTVDPDTIDWTIYNSKNFPFRLRQRPGDENALGKVKIMFPNKHNVYLHDTPTKQLFLRSDRTFSSGCVRVADALNLSEWILSETPGWERKMIDMVVASGNETRINPSNKLPVHILYFTAVTGDDGLLRLVSDVYQRDERLIKALSTNHVNANEK